MARILRGDVLATSYQLLDFGNGRRLERFGDATLDRPCPAAEQTSQRNPAAWQHADARFEGRNEEKGRWTNRRPLPARWTLSFGSLQFELKCTEFGHVGLFPEQAENWNWIAETISAVKPEPTADRLKVLNLFAYTGGSTLAAAAAGAQVTHVDAAKNVVAWARRNAELSGLANAPIRWIAEDAVKFVQRELKRGNRYDAVILDPPSYGHGPKGETWQLAKHLPTLLAMCGELTACRPAFLLQTCHTPGYDARTLTAMMQDVWGKKGTWAARPLDIRAATGARLPSGVVVRCSNVSPVGRTSVRMEN
jgi:23S rRNA (cytosine1962-C5)-methyltransferase